MSSTEPSSRPHFGRWVFVLREQSWSWSAEIIAMWDIGLTEASGAALVLDRLHPDDREEIRGRLSAALEHGSVLAGQARLRTDTSGERVFSFLGDLELDGQGEPARLVGYSIDVTDEVRDATREAVDGATRNRRAIEQVKGALMVTYRLDDVTAFTLLRTFSREHNVRIHDLAERVTQAMSAGGSSTPTDGLSLTDLLGRVARELQVSQRPEEHAETH